jgi:hypothetical protein
MRQWVIVMAVLALGGCGAGRVAGPSDTDLTAALIRLEGAGPPDGPAEACWDTEVLPTIIETVTEQVLEEPEVRGPDGAVVTPAVVSSESRQEIVQEPGQVWFRVPCAAEVDVEFIATLQRALKARGFYLLPLTGVYDPPTAEAVRRYQATRGFDSPRLTLAAAQDLGIVAADLGLDAVE